jgi:hypothetical protein
MGEEVMRRRWRFKLRSLLLAMVGLSMLLAATAATGPPREMFRFDNAEGGAVVYARHYGWPVAYLRVPSGEHAGRIPADLFVPGLIVDLALVGCASAAVVVATTMLQRGARLVGKQEACTRGQGDESEDRRPSNGNERES